MERGQNQRYQGNRPPLYINFLSYNDRCRAIVLLTQKEKKDLVIKLAEDGSTSREIAKEVRMSLGNIGKILREYTGDEHPDKEPCLDSQAFQMFKEGKTPLDVSIHLNLDTESTIYLYQNYARLSNLGDIIKIYNEMGRDLPIFIHLYKALRKEGLTTVGYIHDFINLYKTREVLRTECEEMTDYLIKMNERRLFFEDDLKVKEQLVSTYDRHPSLYCY